MSAQKGALGDLGGLAPVGRAVEASVKKSLEFLERICGPASDELGLLLKEKVHRWRSANTARILEKADAMVADRHPEGGVSAHPRLVALAMNHGSWCDTDEVQRMWAGLLASSCTPDGPDDSSLLFMNLLSQMTASQARVLDYACEQASVEVFPSGLIGTRCALSCPLTRLKEISFVDDVQRLDRELDHLRSLGLVQAGFEGTDVTLTAGLTPTALGLQMYVRCHGSGGSPVEYFGLERPPTEPDSAEPSEPS